MAADNEVRLVSKIVETKDYLSVVQRGVDHTWFRDPESRKLFKFLSDHYSQYSVVPSATTVKDNYPTCRLLRVDDSIDYLIDQFVAYRRATHVYDMVREAVELVSDPDNTDKVVSMCRSRLSDLDGATPEINDLDLTHEATKRYGEYLSLKERKGSLLGAPTGFKTIDEATAGLQPGQLVTIVASPKTGKSQLALKMASVIHSDGLRPMYQSFEMSNSEQQQRFDALRANISHGRLRSGILTSAEEERYQKMLAELESQHPIILTDSTVGMTVTALGAKIAQYDPDVVFVDGTYLMLDEGTGESNTPQALTGITRSLKRLAQRMDKPIVCTTQTLLWKMQGKRKIDQNSIGYSSSFLQDSDVVLGLERTEDDDDDRRILKIVASRNCGPAEVELIWDWGNGRFEEFGASSGSLDLDDYDDDLDGLIAPDYGVTAS